MAMNLPTTKKRAQRLLLVLAVLIAYAAATAHLARRYTDLPERGERHVQIRGDWFYLRGEKFLIKGVGYDPTRPGELPWSRERSYELMNADFANIRAAGFNTIRTWEALSLDELAEAQRQGLAVIQGIWVDPKGDFADPTFRREAMEKARTLVRQARNSPAVLAYLVMNEPEPEQVQQAGLETMRGFLRELAAAVRAEDPKIPVGFANWPGLEFFDEPGFDFVAANLHPFRPQAINDTLGYQSMVTAWKRRAAPDRPLLITEYGVSVSPNAPAEEEPGGRSEEEQALLIPRLAEAITRSGAAGGAVFMWIDGWWKNNEHEGDEDHHDPDDGEEWFGLNAMDAIDDNVGRPRPALTAMQAWNQAVLTLPFDGPLSSREAEVEAHVETDSPVTMTVALNQGPEQRLPVVRDGPWLRGRFGLLEQARGAQHAAFHLYADGEALARFERILIPPGEGARLTLKVTGSGAQRTLIAQVQGPAGEPVPDTEVRLALTEASHKLDRAMTLQTDAQGQAQLPLRLPEDRTVLYALATLPAAGTAVPLDLAWTFLSLETAQ